MTTEHRENAQTQHNGKHPRWVTRFAVACLLLLLLAGTRLTGTGWADGGTTVSVAPASQGVTPGNTVTTDVRVENVANLYTVDFEISFDPALVEGVRIEPGGFLSPDWLLENTIDNESGVARYAVSQLNPSEPVSGTGVLATITWRGITAGTSPISFTSVSLYARGGGAPIPAALQNGDIVVSEELPTITGLTPISTTVGGPAFTLTVEGSSFVEGSTVHWDGAARATTFVSDAQLTAAIAAEDVAAAGTVYVTVVNPPPDGRISNAVPFEIVELGPEPSSWFVYVPLIFNGYPE